MAEPGEELDPNEPFQKKFFRRMGDLGMPFVMRNIAQDIDQKIRAPSWATGRYFEPRSDLPIEDQRGMTLPELDLQAKYLQSRGAYGPLPPFDPDTPVTPLGIAAGALQIPRAAQQIRAKEKKKPES